MRAAKYNLNVLWYHIRVVLKYCLIIHLLNVSALAGHPKSCRGPHAPRRSHVADPWYRQSNFQTLDYQRHLFIDTDDSLVCQKGANIQLNTIIHQNRAFTTTFKEINFLYLTITIINNKHRFSIVILVTRINKKNHIILLYIRKRILHQ